MVTPFAEGPILRQARTANAIDVRELSGGGPVLVVTPHPDDETLGAGMAISAASAAGYEVTVVCLTDGAGSHPNSTTHPKSRLAELRSRELKEALCRLTPAPVQVIAFGLPDQGLSEEVLDREKVAERLAEIAADRGVTSVWTTWEHDPHSDHQAAATVAQRVADLAPGIALWRFPIWGRFINANAASTDSVRTFYSRDLGPIKARALAAHVSQMTRLIEDDPDGFVMEPDVQQHFVDNPEIFIRKSQ